MEAHEAKEHLLELMGAIEECTTSIQKMRSPDAVHFFTEIILNRVKKAEDILRNEWRREQRAC